jgi:uncharacterized protein YeaO (DUF488 family)
MNPPPPMTAPAYWSIVCGRAESGKTDAAIDQWVKDIAPSTALRKWFGHDPERWAEFRRRYAAEIHRHPEQLSTLRNLARQGPITLVFSAHDELHNDAVALRDFLLGRITNRKVEATHR